MTRISVVVVTAVGLVGTACSDQSLAPHASSSEASRFQVVPDATGEVPIVPVPGSIVEIPVGFVRAVNNSGHVVGNSGDGPVVWEDGTLTTLPLPEGEILGWAYGINDAGQIAGRTTWRGLLWENGTVTDLGALPTHNSSTAWWISSAGHIAGTSYSGEAPTSAYVWQNGEMSALPPLPGDAVSSGPTAQLVNASGHVVGVSVDSTKFVLTYVLWREGAPTSTGVLGGTFENDRTPTYSAVGLTDADEVIFNARNDVGVLVWRDGVTTTLPIPSEGATGFGAQAITAGGLILVNVFYPPRCADTYHWSCEDIRPGVWVEGQFRWIRDPLIDFGRCWAMSDVGYAVCDGEGKTLLMRLLLGGGVPDGSA